VRNNVQRQRRYHIHWHLFYLSTTINSVRMRRETVEPGGRGSDVYRYRICLAGTNSNIFLTSDFVSLDESIDPLSP